MTFTETITNGGSTPAYQWKKNGTNVATGSTYSTTSLVNSDDSLENRSEVIATDLSSDIYELMPNPFDQRYTIQAQAEMPAAEKVQMIDLTGRVILEQNWPEASSSLEIETATLQPGVYVVKFLGKENNPLTTLRCVKI